MNKGAAIVSKLWDSGMVAPNEYQQLKPGAKYEPKVWPSFPELHSVD